MLSQLALVLFIAFGASAAVAELEARSLESAAECELALLNVPESLPGREMLIQDYGFELNLTRQSFDYYFNRTDHDAIHDIERGFTKRVRRKDDFRHVWGHLKSYLNDNGVLIFSSHSLSKRSFN